MGRPKLLLPWGKTTIIGHLIEQWHGLGARQIVVVCRPGDNGMARELDRLKFPPGNRVINMAAESGMFSSIVCAANWNGWDPAIAAWAIVLGDQPHLQNKTLQTLLTFHEAHPNNICQPSYGGHGRHPVLLRRGAWTELARSNARTLKDFLGETSTPLLECPIDDPHLELDLDTPEDYRKMRGLTAANEHGHE